MSQRVSVVAYGCVLAGVALLGSVTAYAYPRVKLTNLSGTIIHGGVKYAACKSDTFEGLQPGDTWVPSAERGGCLVTRIYAATTIGVIITDYTSSGTSYSEFFVTMDGNSAQRLRVFSWAEAPTQNRAMAPIPTQPTFNVAHMVNTPGALLWGLDQGANAVEMDLRFHSDGTPFYFLHGGICDCICAQFEGASHVCRHLHAGCESSTPLNSQLNLIASKSSQVAMVVLDSKVDTDRLTEGAQRAGGVKIVQALEQQLFARGYKGFVVIAVPKWTYAAYLKAAAAQANTSQYMAQMYFSVDMDNGDVDGARATLNHLWKDVGSPNVIYGSGTTACAATTYYAETMLAVWYQNMRRIRMVNIWTLDKKDSMQRYLWLGARGVLTNKPSLFPDTTKLAKPGFLP
ncbi:MAG TPA: hypothetical protein VKB38_12365 [Terracidiphilus sp.]|nr:hypothetical protein [Terracidiphilus sp.]